MSESFPQRLVVQAIHHSVEVEQITSLLSKYAPVSVDGPYPMGAESLYRLIYEFQSAEGARNALNEFIYCPVFGQELQIFPYFQDVEGSLEDPACSVIVHNIDKSVNLKWLHQVMNEFGSVLFCQNIGDDSEGQHRSLVQFRHPNEAETAIKKTKYRNSSGGLIFATRSLAAQKLPESLGGRNEIVSQLKDPALVPQCAEGIDKKNADQSASSSEGISDDSDAEDMPCNAVANGPDQPRPCIRNGFDEFLGMSVSRINSLSVNPRDIVKLSKSIVNYSIALHAIIHSLKDQEWKRKAVSVFAGKDGALRFDSPVSNPEKFILDSRISAAEILAWRTSFNGIHFPKDIDASENETNEILMALLELSEQSVKSCIKNANLANRITKKTMDAEKGIKENKRRPTAEQWAMFSTRNKNSLEAIMEFVCPSDVVQRKPKKAKNAIKSNGEQQNETKAPNRPPRKKEGNKAKSQKKLKIKQEMEEWNAIQKGDITYFASDAENKVFRLLRRPDFNKLVEKFASMIEISPTLLKAVIPTINKYLSGNDCSDNNVRAILMRLPGINPVHPTSTNELQHAFPQENSIPNQFPSSNLNQLALSYNTVPTVWMPYQPDARQTMYQHPIPSATPNPNPPGSPDPNKSSGLFGFLSRIFGQ